MGWYLDGRVSAVIGTHTHVPTADTRILPGGTAYQTDCGMTGPYQSVIGVETDIIMQRFLTALPVRMEAARHGAELHAVIVDVDESTGKARAVRRHAISRRLTHGRLQPDSRYHRLLHAGNRRAAVRPGLLLFVAPVARGVLRAVGGGLGDADRRGVLRLRVDRTTPMPPGWRPTPPSSSRSPSCWWRRREPASARA